MFGPVKLSLSEEEVIEKVTACVCVCVRASEGEVLSREE